MQPLEGARVLVLSADPFAVEPLAAALEDDGADVIFRPSAHGLPEPEALDAVVVDDSARAAAPEAIADYLAALPDDVLVVESIERARETLLAELSDRSAPAAPAAHFEPSRLAPSTPARPAVGRSAWRDRLDTRLTRAALTVLVVTGLLWVVGRSPLARNDDLPPVSSPGGPDAAGRGELAGRVVRAGSNEGLAGASIAASGPSGSMSTVTDEQGRWRLTNLRAGRYVVFSTASRYAARQQQVDVPEGRAVENVNFSLDPEAP